MKTYVVVYSRAYDPGLVLTGTVLAYDIVHGLSQARKLFDITFEQIRSIILQ